MRFLALYHPVKLTPPTPELMAEMGRFIEETTKAGILLGTDGVKPGGTTARVRLSKGKLTVTDGPFAEAKELIGGYAILQVESREQLIEVIQRFIQIAGDGECEIHQMYDGPPPAH